MNFNIIKLSPPGLWDRHVIKNELGFLPSTAYQVIQSFH